MEGGNFEGLEEAMWLEQKEQDGMSSEQWEEVERWARRLTMQGLVC